MKKQLNQFIYYDSDYLCSPPYWLQARIMNRLSEGYEVWRDEKEMAWKGVKHVASN